MKISLYSGLSTSLAFLAGALIGLRDPVYSMVAFAGAVLFQWRAIQQAIHVMGEDVLRASRELDSLLSGEARHG